MGFVAPCFQRSGKGHKNRTEGATSARFSAIVGAPFYGPLATFPKVRTYSQNPLRRLCAPLMPIAKTIRSLLEDVFWNQQLTASGCCLGRMSAIQYTLLHDVSFLSAYPAAASRALDVRNGEPAMERKATS